MATIAEALTIALEHHGAGRLGEAEGIYRQILAVEPSQPDALHLLGLLAQQVGRHEIAVEFIAEALAGKPDFAGALYNLCTSYLALGRFEQAVAGYDRVVAVQPGWADAHNNRGNALSSLGRLDEAVASYRAAIACRPDHADGYVNLGVALHGLKRLDEAVAGHREALRLNPDHAEAHNNLGSSLAELGKPDEALASYRRAVAINPDYAEAHRNLGDTLRTQGRLTEAEASYRRALDIDPRHAQAHDGLGSALFEQGDLTRAMEEFRTALALNPTLADVHNNLGHIHVALGRIDEAIAYFDRAVALKPDVPDHHVNRGLTLFATGRLNEAWPEFDWRWNGHKNHQRRPFPQPWWDGAPLDAGQTLLIWGEQGLADEILAIGMLPDAMTRAPRCVVECDHRLAALFARSFPAATIVPRRAPPDPRAVAADVQIPAFGLGRVFRTDKADFPRHDGYLVADPARVERWKFWLATLPPGPKVGLSWRGRLPNRERSLHFPPLDRTAILLATPGAVFVNLQYDGFADDIEALRRLTGVDIHSPPGVDLTDDLDEVAAVMTGLDAVAGPATAVGDLAGALGRPTWMYAYYPVSNEKEICGSDHVPWCPAIRVRTCGFGEDWTGALTAIAEDLARFVAARTGNG